ncbi:MAG: DUF1292 domain-containing protein [Oscillospiraceae bacterium]
MADTLDYTPDLYTLVDEEGKEQTFEMLDALEQNGEKYYALVPYYPEDASQLAEDDGNLVILKAQIEDGEEILESIEDDEEFEKIGKIFMDRIEEIFEEEDCDCDDECGCGCDGDSCDCGCHHE